MTDNGLAALAAAIRAAEQMHADRLGVVGPAYNGPPSEWYDGYAAAILGPHGVFLPDGMPVPLGNLTEEEIVAAFKSGYLVPRPPAEQAATIATLRAALDGLVVKVDEYLVGIERGFEHWEADHPVTGEHLSGDPKVAFLGRDQWYEPTLALRAALAHAKEAGG